MDEMNDSKISETFTPQGQVKESLADIHGDEFWVTTKGSGL
jgi:hypothetical protein